METQSKEATAGRIIGRYAIYDEIAAGGMAVVHIGRLLGQVGFSRTVAIKRLHPQYAKNPNFVAMFLDEARLAVRVQHPNVVAPLDVLVVQGEVLVVMEYVAGDTLARLQRSQGAQERPATHAIISGVLCNALYGLHAAHEAVGENGQPLSIVHRDVSPQNIMVGTDGIARVLDFGVAKAAMRSQCTTEGEVKGKIAYMAPEQIEALELDRRTDIFAAGIVAWEALARRRLFNADQPSETIARILRSPIRPPSAYEKQITPELDAVILKALERDPRHRFQSARDFAAALERVCPPANPSTIGDWVRSVGGDGLSSLAERVAAIEAKSSASKIRPIQPPPPVSGTIPLGVPPPRPKLSSRIQLDSNPRITIPNDTASRYDASGLSPHKLELEKLAISEMETVRPPAPRSHRRKIAYGIAALMASGLLLLVVRQALHLGRNEKVSVDGSTLKTGTMGNSAAPSAFSTLAAREVRPADLELAKQAPAAFAASSPVHTEPVVASSSVNTKSSSQQSETAQKGARKVRLAPSGVNRQSPPNAKPDCALPFFVDAKGIRRLKAECL